MARPIASLSVDAQERHEKKEKVHKDEWFQSHSNKCNKNKVRTKFDIRTKHEYHKSIISWIYYKHMSIKGEIKWALR
jgi:hypothetical protein